MYADADLAGEKPGYKSTSGVLVAITWRNTFAAFTGRSQKQGHVSCSTPEAEVIAAADGLRHEGLPGLDLWETLLRAEPYHKNEVKEGETPPHRDAKF
jgi:hypothetical protein